MHYRAEIDGLRAFAVIAVILFHAGIDTVPGGFLGVDVFFVISGYLITSLLVSDLRNGTFSILYFYERRAKRILPALLFVCICVLPFAILFLEPLALENFFKSFIATGFFSSNFYFLGADDYFGIEPDQSLLLHTWSLAVEEQYYIFFPVFLAFIWRFRRSTVLLSLVVFLIASLLTAEFLNSRAGAFYLLPTRMWELLVGSIVSFGKFSFDFDRQNNKLPEILSLAGFAAITFSFVYFDENSHLPGLYSLVPVLGTALVITHGTPATYIGRMLALKPVVLMGLISYSAYLWHHPLFSLSNAIIFEELSMIYKFGMVIATILLATFSWKYIETPVRRYKFKSPTRFLFPLSLYFVVIIIVGVFANNLENWPTKVSNTVLASSTFGGISKKSDYLGKLYGNINEEPEFILYGDSHAMQYMGVMEKWANANDRSFLAITHSACFSFPTYTNSHKNKVRKNCINLIDVLERAMTEYDQAPVIFSFRWGKSLALRQPFESLNLEQNVSASTALLNKQRLDLILSDIRHWKEKWPNSKWLIVGNVPGSGLVKEGGYIKCHYFIDTKCPDSFAKEKGELFEVISDFSLLAESEPKIVFINPYDVLCDENTCFVLNKEGELYYSDHAHLTLLGAEKVFSMMKREFILINY